jgi:hypothetical protein
MADVKAQLFTLILYVFAYEGGVSLWYKIPHFRHVELEFPGWLLVVIAGGVLPMLAGLLVAATGYLDKTRLPIALLVGPLMLQIFVGLADDSFYPPWHTEVAGILLAAGIQTLAAVVGWRLGSSIHAHLTPSEAATHSA